MFKENISTLDTRQDTLAIRLLGGLEVSINNRPVKGFVSNKARALFVYLAMSNRPRSRDEIAFLFWHDKSEKRAKANLRRVLPNLRKLLGDYLLITRETIGFNRESCYWLDVEALESALTVADVEGETTGNNLAALQTILTLYRSPLLEGFQVRDALAFEEWLLLQREYLQETVINCLAHMAERSLDAKSFTASLEIAKQLLRLEPWRESAYRQCMVALASIGQRTEALAQYDSCRRMLATEFDAEPSPETVALYTQIKENQVGGSELSSHLFEANEAIDPIPAPQIDWGESPRAVAFYGRQREVEQLKQYLVDTRCSLVAILGIGGTGKTTLAGYLIHKLSQQRTPQGQPANFDFVIWRSLVNAPHLEQLLEGWLRILGRHMPGAEATLPATLDQQLTLLFSYLQRRRCLLVLDNMESILQEGVRSGTFRAGYEAYGQLVRRMGQTRHQSCLLITSREEPREFRTLEEDYSEVRSLRLDGLPDAAALALLHERAIHGKAEKMSALAHHYGGNPLALKLVAETIQDLYRGDVDSFLHDNSFIFDDIRDVLQQQFDRLLPTERELLCWLAIARRPVTISTLWEDLAHPLARREIVESIRSLQRRSLVELSPEDGMGAIDDAPRFGLQNVVMEYVTNLLVETIVREVETGNFEWLHCYPLVKAQAQDYVQATQRRLLLEPIVQQILQRRSKEQAATLLKACVEQLRGSGQGRTGYGGASLLHLLLQLNVDLHGFDFSALSIRQADLRTSALAHVNFTNSTILDASFLQTFTSVLHVTFSPDGHLVAAATTSGEVFIWHAKTQQLQTICRGPDGWIWSIEFSADGTILASGGEDGAIRLWNTQTGELRHTLIGHENVVRTLSFSTDGHTLATAGVSGIIILWNVATGEITHSLAGHTDFILSITFDPQGRFLASASGDQTIILWDATNEYQLFHHLHGHNDAVTAVAFAPDGKSLASGSADQTLCLWDVYKGKLRTTLSSRGDTAWSVCFSPDGELLASTSDRGMLSLWDPRNGQCLHSFNAHTGSIWSIAFSPDSRILVSGGSDEAVRFWDRATAQLLYTLRGTNPQIWRLTNVHDRHRVFSGSANGTLCLWDWDVNECHPIYTIKAHNAPIRGLVYHPARDELASGGGDNLIHTWDPSTGEKRQTLRGHSEVIFDLAYNATGEILASASGDGTICLWNAATGQLITTLRGHEGRVSSVSFDPTGKVVASAGFDGYVRLWSVPSGEIVQAWDFEMGFLLRAEFSPDGRWLAVSSTTSRDVHLYDSDTGKIYMVLQGHTNPVDAIAFSWQRPVLATGSLDQSIRLWDISADGTESPMKTRPIKVLPGHHGAVRTLDWCDNRYLFSGGQDGTVRVWDTVAGQSVLTLEADKAYTGLNITGVTGLTLAQYSALRALGAIEVEDDPYTDSSPTNL